MTNQYNRIYKDEQRVVAYVTPEAKSILAQEAIDQNTSLSALAKPVLEKLADEIKQRKLQPAR